MCVCVGVCVCVCVCWCACACAHVCEYVSEREREKDRRISRESEKAGDDQTFATPDDYLPKTTHTPTHHSPSHKHLATQAPTNTYYLKSLQHQKI